jgi:hypothetical protein
LLSASAPRKHSFAVAFAHAVAFAFAFAYAVAFAFLVVIPEGDLLLPLPFKLSSFAAGGGPAFPFVFASALPWLMRLFSH